MMLACSSMDWTPQFNLIETIVWSVALLAPIGTFLALPRLLPLGRELRWSSVKARWPLAWIAWRGAPEGASWRERLRAAWRRDVLDEHPEGSCTGEVVRDARLLARTRASGWIAAALTVGAAAFIAGIAILEQGAFRGRIAFSALVVGLATAWVARVAGSGAALLAQSLSLGRRAYARLGIGAMVGTGYGAIAGFVAGFVAVLIAVPLLDVLTWTTPTARETMIGFTGMGVGGAFLGALLGALLITPLALLTRRRA